MDNNKIQFQREKVEKLIDITNFTAEEKKHLKDYLINVDFYHKPGAVVYHHNYEGGLVEHSLEFYEELRKQWKAHPQMEVSIHSVIVVSLFHDLCKTEDYIIHENGVIERIKGLQGHASRSIKMLEQVVKLSEIEKKAILYHMGEWTSNYEEGTDFSKAIRGDEGLFIYLSHVADMISAIGGF